MKERGILFSAPMVRALLAGTKTQTRRAIKMHRGDDSCVFVDNGTGWWPYRSEDGESMVMLDGCVHAYACPYGQPGDRLWVRETWALESFEGDGDGERLIWRADMTARWSVTGATIFYLASDYKPARWRPAIHMPRWASRITLEITAVRVERLQDISEADCIAEGCELYPRPHKQHYRNLWESINGPGSWDANPWVWVLEFKRV